MPTYVDGSYPWPFDGRLERDNSALLIVDMQVDFCARGGWHDQLGIDLAPLRRPIEPLRRVLGGLREAGYRILYARECYQPDHSDLNRTRRWRTSQRGLAVGERGNIGRVLVHGEPGCEIVPELAPQPGEPVIDKPGMSAFYATELEQILHALEIRNLMISGVTTDGSVQATLRDANDRGYECLLLEDCCGAVDADQHRATVEMLGILNGLYGSIGQSAALLKAIA
jgi:nicotinamidase-related amidase